MSVQNKMAPVLTLFHKVLTSIYSEMLENVIAGSLREAHALKCSKCYSAVSSFSVINCCTRCSNVERNPS